MTGTESCTQAPNDAFSPAIDIRISHPRFTIASASAARKRSHGRNPLSAYDKGKNRIVVFIEDGGRLFLFRQFVVLYGRPYNHRWRFRGYPLYYS